MSFVLPKSLQKELHPIEEEVAPARAMTPEERLRVVALVCRSALAVLNQHPKRDLVLQLRDPMPASSREAFARLRGAR